jgi:hypothetical protein
VKCWLDSFESAFCRIEQRAVLNTAVNLVIRWRQQIILFIFVTKSSGDRFLLHGNIFGNEACKWTHKHDLKNASLEQLESYAVVKWLELCVYMYIRNQKLHCSDSLLICYSSFYMFRRTRMYVIIREPSFMCPAELIFICVYNICQRVYISSGYI